MWPNPQETADLITFTEEILNGKLNFLCSLNWKTNDIFHSDCSQIFCENSLLLGPQGFPLAEIKDSCNLMRNISQKILVEIQP